MTPIPRSLTRLDERRYETVIARADGVRFLVKGVGHIFAIQLRRPPQIGWSTMANRLAARTPATKIVYERVSMGDSLVDAAK